MSDFRARMFEEYEQLLARQERLEKFILTPAYDGLPEIERADLKEQLSAMQTYSSVLSRRVSRLCGAA